MATTIHRNKNNGLRNDIQLMQRARYGGLVGARIFAQVARRSRAIAERHHSGSFGRNLRLPYVFLQTDASLLKDSSIDLQRN